MEFRAFGNTLTALFVMVFVLAGNGWVAMAAGNPSQPTFTLQGQVLDPTGRPLPDCGIRLVPVLPDKGVDDDNVFYRIPGYDDHYTVTDASGCFRLEGLVDYPENGTHRYRAWVNADRRYLYLRAQMGADVVALQTLKSRQPRLVIYTERAAALKVVLRDREGRPVNGTWTVSIETGGGRKQTNTAAFVDGTWIIGGLPQADPGTPAHVALLDFPTSAAARRATLAAGGSIGHGQFVDAKMVREARVDLLPGQMALVEWQLP